MVSIIKNKKILTNCLLLVMVVLVVFMFSPQPAQSDNLADGIMGQIDSGATAGELGGAPPDPRVIVEEVIKIVLSIVGILFMVLVAVGGYWYITSHGDEERAKKATRTIEGAIIGIIVVVMAYSITLFIASRVAQSVVEGGIIQK